LGELHVDFEQSFDNQRVFYDKGLRLLDFELGDVSQRFKVEIGNGALDVKLVLLHEIF
jgi:hypothetical protein